MAHTDPLPPLQNVRIFVQAGEWMLDHELDPSAADVLDLFGTYIIPMPYTAAVSRARVEQELTARNPGVEIR